MPVPLSREAAFELWAPSASPWSVWAKPVLFASWPEWSAPELDVPQLQAAWAPPADGATALVIDLPGVQSVQTAAALCLLGFRPVPLINAVPEPREVVAVTPILDALVAVTPRCMSALQGLPAGAPPAFFLDALRRSGKVAHPGDFDNRSISLPTDFPSAAFLQSRGIARVVLMTDRPAPAADLAHTLRRWQGAGLTLWSTDGTGPPVPITVERPSWFGAVWHNALSLVGLRRNPLGGFGDRLPLPSSG